MFVVLHEWLEISIYFKYLSVAGNALKINRYHLLIHNDVVTSNPTLKNKLSIESLGLTTGDQLRRIDISVGNPVYCHNMYFINILFDYYRILTLAHGSPVPVTRSLMIHIGYLHIK